MTEFGKMLIDMALMIFSNNWDCLLIKVNHMDVSSQLNGSRALNTLYDEENYKELTWNPKIEPIQKSFGLCIWYTRSLMLVSNIILGYE